MATPGVRERLVAIHEEAVASVAGDLLVRRALPPLLERLVPRAGGKARLLGLGKAAAAMARGAIALVPDASGVVVAPAGEELPPAVELPPGLELVPGDHPRPGSASLAAGGRLLAEAAALTPPDTALLLVSGGGSALAEVPADGLSLEDLHETTRLLMGAGAPIEDLNVVRRHLSQLKGGGLGRALGAGRSVALVLSDVEGDDPAVVASGPAWPDPTTHADALDALRRAGLVERVPAAVRAHLEAGVRGQRPETPKPGDPALSRIVTEVVGGPSDLARAAATAARRRGLEVISWPAFVRGDVAEVAARLAAYGRGLARAGAGRIVIAVGEPTVVLPENPGRGGRSQALALRVALAIEGVPLAFLAAGSDGRDGDSDHAGAVVDGTTAAAARAAGVDLEAALARAASAEACSALGLALPGRRTGTNVTDLHLLAVTG